MKVLIDECVPWPLHRLLVGHECTSVARQGWAGSQNGALLQRARGEFDVFLTADQNLRYQQTLARAGMCVVELSSNDWRRIEAHALAILAALEQVPDGGYGWVEVP